LLWPPLILIAIGTLAVYYMAEHTPILPAEPEREPEPDPTRLAERAA
jgi:hypothetical protein